MAYKVHQISKYNYQYDGRGPSGLQLFGSQGKVIEGHFLDDTAALPAPVISPDLNFAQVFFKRSALPGLIDMLRNESPVSVTIINQPPLGFVVVHTGLEPVGEGES